MDCLVTNKRLRRISLVRIQDPEALDRPAIPDDPAHIDDRRCVHPRAVRHTRAERDFAMRSLGSTD